MVMAIYVFAGTMIGTPPPSGHELDALVILPLQIFLLFDLIVFKLEAPASSRESEGAAFGSSSFLSLVLLPSGLRDGDGLAGPDNRNEPAVLLLSPVDAPLESVVVIEAAALLLLLPLPEVVVVMVVVVVLVLDDVIAAVAKLDLFRGEGRAVKEVDVAVGAVAAMAAAVRVRGRRVGRRRVREELLPVGLVARSGRGRVGDVVVLVLLLLLVVLVVVVLIRLIVVVGGREGSRPLLLGEEEVRGRREESAGAARRAGRLLPVVVVVVGLAAEYAAAVGGEVQVDERLGHRVAVVVRGRLEGHEGVDVDGADGEAVGAVVVRVDGPARAQRVLRVAAVPLAGGGQAEGDADRGRERALGDFQAKELANVSNDALKKGEGRSG